jgi:hypothetical protein
MPPHRRPQALRGGTRFTRVAAPELGHEEVDAGCGEVNASLAIATERCCERGVVRAPDAPTSSYAAARPPRAYSGVGKSEASIRARRLLRVARTFVGQSHGKFCFASRDQCRTSASRAVYCQSTARSACRPVASTCHA